MLNKAVWVCLNVYLQDTLFYLVKTSLKKYVDFIEDVCEFEVTVKNMTDVIVSYPGSDQPNPIDKNPLFTVELIEKVGSVHCL